MTGLEGHLIRAIVVSGGLALLITAAVAFAWWRGKRWVRDRGGARWTSAGQSTMLNRMDDQTTPPPGGSPRDREGTPGHDDDPPASRFVRDAAARAAALRLAWDRSYREARESEGGPGASAAAADLPARLEELLREQRETNALLRELLTRLGPPSD